MTDNFNRETHDLILATLREFRAEANNHFDRLNERVRTLEMFRAGIVAVLTVLVIVVGWLAATVRF